ncbi:hypothetical protein E2C01_076026 [Portunus trituberculatus]|uniref:Uncharacterized protein n=1 Tax=Portunus trituberculatus TaxID=210409 RepID=A0A5B7I7N6_PORTR|nr:hypothetical protein [Portunus trituberculatus]
MRREEMSSAMMAALMSEEETMTVSCVRMCFSAPRNQCRVGEPRHDRRMFTASRLHSCRDGDGSCMPLRESCVTLRQREA